ARSGRPAGQRCLDGERPAAAHLPAHGEGAARAGVATPRVGGIRARGERGDGVIEDLRRELAAAGVRGRWQRRALEEARDHLTESEGVFGDPRLLAADIAAVVGTSRTRRAAWAAFTALAVTGAAYLVAWYEVADNGQPDIASGKSPALGIAVTLALFFVPQVTFVAGVLMLWRAVRLSTPAPAAELRVVRRRAAVALAGGVVTAACWVLYVQQFSVPHEPAIVVLAAVALAAPAASALLVRGASAPRVTPEGTAGDVFDDLGLPGLRAHHWVCAIGFAAVGGAAALAAGWRAEGTVTDGLVRGLPEATAVLLAYAALGRVLSLRRP